MRNPLILMFIALSHLLVFQPAAQVTVQLTVNDGDATTTCTDLFNLPGNAFWGIEVEGQGWTISPESFTCPEFQSPPFVKYEQAYSCPGDLPDSIEVCFRAFDKDGLFCFLVPDCQEIICQKYPMPEPFTPQTYTLNLAPGGASSGFVNFTLSATGGLATNDLPCDAIDLGELGPGAVLGDTSLSQFTNRCATNNDEPNPFFDSGGFFNSQGVWFTFTVGQGVGDLLIVDAVSDPSGLGDAIDLELGIYRTSDGTCSGQLIEYRLDIKQPGFDERLLAECLGEGERLYVLVDGSNNDGQGLFGLRVEDPTVTAAPQGLCDALNVGVVPDGGAITLSNQTNVCADNVGDPPVPQFGVESSVWYAFSPPTTGNTIIDVINDPLGIEPLNAQIAVFSSISGTCNGPFVVEGAAWDPSDYSESIEFPCLDPQQVYWLLIDGEGVDQDGVFDLVISDGGVAPPSISFDTAICFGSSLIVGNSAWSSTGTFTEFIPLPNGCDSSVTVNLTVWDQLIVEAQQVSPVTSALVDNGVVSVSAQGGVPPYSWMWSNGQVLQQIDSLSAGLYCVTVTDAVGCSSESCIEVIEDIPEVVAQAFPTDVSCAGGTDGQIVLTVTGADPPYSILWSGPPAVIQNDGGALTLTGLPAGLYTFVVTNAAGQTDTVSTAINEPTPLVIDLVSSENPLCFGLCDGSLLVNATGGLSPYTYLWSGGVSGPQRLDLCSGTYILSVTDANSCVLSDTFEIIDPQQLIAETTLLSSVTCFGDTDGSASVSLNGEAVEWLWDNGENTSLAVALSAGNHQVTVTDTLGCTATGIVTIPGPSQPFSLQISLASPVTCAGDADGSLLGVTTGGYTGNTQFFWSTGDSGPLATNLGPGSYVLQATDAGGCSTSDTFNLISPDEIVPEFSVNPATCSGQLLDGQIAIVSVSGGQPPFLYGLDSSALITQPFFGNLPPSTYEVVIQDANGCVRTFSSSVSPPPVIGLQVDGEQLLRLGESLDLEAFTALQEVIFMWSPADSLTCTDCPDPVATPVRDITYTVTVVDTATGCVEEASVLVRIDPDREVFIPNIFTPNGDGTNDEVTVFSDLNVIISLFQVFDRWGNEVYESRNFPPNDLQFGWDGQLPSGKPAPSGVYVVLAQVRYADGVTLPVSGSVTLVR